MQFIDTQLRRLLQRDRMSVAQITWAIAQPHNQGVAPLGPQRQLRRLLSLLVQRKYQRKHAEGATLGH